MESTKYPWSPKKFLYILCSIPKPLEVHGVHRQSMDSIYLFVKSVDFIQSPWSPHVNPWILCIPWTPQGLPGGLKSTEIFSPVVRFELVCTILTLATLEKWSITALDVKSAFLYGTLDKEIYMEQPEGFVPKDKQHKVLRLRRAIYGLKQAARAWWHELDRSLKDLGFTRLYADAGIFVARHSDGTLVIMLAYVNDIIVTGPNATQIASKKQLFMDKWKCCDLGQCKEFLHMRIEN